MKKEKEYLYLTPLIVLLVLVLFAFCSSPAAADYSGDHPLTIYDHDTINGSLVYETVTDGTKYQRLYAMGDGNVTQDITISIPATATVKMARLYNTYCWSTSDYHNNIVPGVPAEVDFWFTNTTDYTRKKVCVHGYSDGQIGSVPNPINYDGTDAMQYWDTKNLTKYGGMYDFPSGEFAWNVTDMVTGSGTYTAKIENNDSSPTPSEYFSTFGFGLLVVYENASDPEVEYWVAEGCDILIARSFETQENATTSATFGALYNSSKVGEAANLTTVLTCSDGGYSTPPENMMYFNDNEIGPSTAGGIEHYAVNYFEVYDLLQTGNNVVEFQDRDDCEYVHNAFLVVGGPVMETSATVVIKPETLMLGSNENFTADVTLPAPHDVNNIDTNTVECDGAPALSGTVAGSTYTATFSILDLARTQTGDAVKMTVTGELTDGTRFEGNDTVTVRPLWMSSSARASGLGDVGTNSTPAVFNKDGTWYLIAGEEEGVFSGYRAGSSWQSDYSVVAGLGDVGTRATPVVFNMSGTWHLIAGNASGEFTGYHWNETGSRWEANETIVTGLGPAVVSGEAAPAVFNMDGTWYLITGNAYGRFDYGYDIGKRWTGSTWVNDSAIITGLGEIGRNSKPVVVYKDEDAAWYLIAGEEDGVFNGYKWSGSVWERYYPIASGLEDVGVNSAPAVFNNSWTVISGNSAGTFNGAGPHWPFNLDINTSKALAQQGNVTISWNGTVAAYDIYVTDDYAAGFGNTPTVEDITTTYWNDTNAYSDPIYTTFTQRYYKVVNANESADAYSESVGKYDVNLGVSDAYISVPHWTGKADINEVLKYNNWPGTRLEGGFVFTADKVYVYKSDGSYDDVAYLKTDGTWSKALDLQGNKAFHVWTEKGTYQGPNANATLRLFQ